MVEVFGVGILIQGESFHGKSESALSLLEKGHRLVADDLVIIQRKGWKYLIGSCFALGRYHMHIRNVGLIHAAHLFGTGAVRKSKRVDLIVCLEDGKEKGDPDPRGFEEEFVELLDVRVPMYHLSTHVGNNLPLLLETLALNWRLQEMGKRTDKEFQKKLLCTMRHKDRTASRT